MRARTEFPHQIKEIENVWISLKDGTRLGARVWMPVDAVRSPVPAVLEYLPYRKDDGTALADAMRHPYFAGCGYAAVRVDLRGTGDSDGLLQGEYLPQEQDDALEVLAWLADQPWCTGHAGMIGYSWGGFNGLQVAARRPAQLKAVITIASTDDRYLDDCHYMGGCLLASDMLKWASSMLCYALQPPDPRFVGERWREMWLHRLENAPELAGDWVSHQVKDAFWKQGSVAEDYGAIQCPVMVVGGWADAYTNAVPRLLEHLAVPRLGLIGPWGHMMPYEGVPGPAIGFLQEAVRWWDHWLKGIDAGIMDGPAVRMWMQDHVVPATFHSLRPGRWICERSWPPATVESRLFVLAGDGGLAQAGAPGAAAPGAAPGSPGVSSAAAEACLDAEVGPFLAAASPPDLVIRGRQECGETAGVWCANGNPDEIAGDQSPDDALSLCFTTAALKEPVEVLGFPLARLYLSADRPIAIVAVRLEDVAPDGTSLLVSWGILNLTHRDGHEAPVPLEPGRWYEVEVESRVCGHRFAAGHHIRLALSPTYWPHAWPSPYPVELKIAVDGPSVLDLPFRKPQTAEGAGRAGDEAPPFGAPEVAGPGGVAGEADAPPNARRDERTRTIALDSETRCHRIFDHEEHERTIPATGARFTDTATDIYAIVEDGPLSATVRCERETRSAGSGVDWRVSIASEMTCDAGSFCVKEEYDAYEGGVLVFAGTRTHSIPREWV
jgi:predicted acyl esterase